LDGESVTLSEPVLYDFLLTQTIMAHCHKFYIHQL
jgi:hypothetical protein